MQEFLCGECAQRNELSLEERIHIALSIKKGIQNKCPSCNNMTFLPLNQNQDVTMLSTDRDTESREEITQTQVGVENVEQLLLFE